MQQRAPGLDIRGIDSRPKKFGPLDIYELGFLLSVLRNSLSTATAIPAPSLQPPLPAISAVEAICGAGCKFKIHRLKNARFVGGLFD